MKTQKRRFRTNKRRGLAAVEAAVCMPVLIVIWFGTVEISRVLTLKHQGQLIASTAAHRVIDSTKELSEIETDMEALAETIGIVDADVTLSRFNSEIVESQITINVAKNSTFGTLLTTPQVTSKYYSFREE